MRGLAYIVLAFLLWVMRDELFWLAVQIYLVWWFIAMLLTSESR